MSITYSSSKSPVPAQLPALDASKIAGSLPRIKVPADKATSVGPMFPNPAATPPYALPSNIPAYEGLVTMPVAEEAWRGLAQIKISCSQGHNNGSEMPVIAGITCVWYDDLASPTFIRTIQATGAPTNTTLAKTTLTVPPGANLTKLEVWYTSRDPNSAVPTCWVYGAIAIRVSWISGTTPGSDFCSSWTTSDGIPSCPQFNAWSYTCPATSQIRAISAYTDSDVTVPDSPNYNGSVFWNLQFTLSTQSLTDPPAPALYPFPWPVVQTVGPMYPDSTVQPAYVPPSNIPVFSNLVSMRDADPSWGSLAQITIVATQGLGNNSELPVINGITCTWYDCTAPIPQIQPTWTRSIQAPRLGRDNSVCSKPTLTIPPLVALTQIDVCYTSAQSNNGTPLCWIYGAVGIRVSWTDSNGNQGSDYCTSCRYIWDGVNLKCPQLNYWTHRCAYSDQIRGISGFVSSNVIVEDPSFDGSIFWNLQFSMGRMPVSMLMTSFTPIPQPGSMADIIADDSSFEQVSNLASTTATNSSKTSPLTVRTTLESSWNSSVTNGSFRQIGLTGSFNLGVETLEELNLEVGKASMKEIFGVKVDVAGTANWNSGTTETTNMRQRIQASTTLQPCKSVQYVMTGVSTSKLQRGGLPVNSVMCYASGQVVWYQYGSSSPGFTQTITNFSINLRAVDSFFMFRVVQNDLPPPCTTDVEVVG